jgi:hypothetical protein
MLSIATSINDDENYELNEGQVNLRGTRVNGFSASSALSNSVPNSSYKIGRLLKNEEANYDSKSRDGLSYRDK